MRQYINPVEVATYALNRLPALYASSEKGKAQQILAVRKQYQEDIKTAVRRAIAAVQRDPLRVSKPLVDERDLKYQQAQTALKDLERFLEERNLTSYETLSWTNLVTIVQSALNQAAWQETEPNPIPSFSYDEEEDKGPGRIFWR